MSKRAKHESWDGERSFETTQWSLVAAASDKSAKGKDALAELCDRYWMPLYAYLRRSGYAGHDAQDLTQAFFSRLLEKETVQRADRGRGKFRSFMLTSLKNFVANQHRRERAQKRGGQNKFVSLNYDAAEDWYQNEPSDGETPERIFNRRWALSVLDNVLDKLQADYERRGKKKLFDTLKGCLTDRESLASPDEIGKVLSIQPGTVKVAVHRLRKKYRAMLEDEIAKTVDSDDEVRKEIQELFLALQNSN